MDPRARISEAFHSQGFSLFGFARPSPPDHLNVFMDWVSAGRHAGMDYLARADTLAKRADPRLLWPNVKSILVLGIPHDRPLADHNSFARVAAYAWGRDYHEVIPTRVDAALRELRKSFDKRLETRAFSDSAPVLERDLAQRAGLGWMGKHTCLIAPGLGSYFLLAEVFLDLEIEPDAPFTPDRCGTCTRCIQACPTGCIRPDRTLDSGRCISYMTIEHKGAIPHDLRRKIGGWVFGCDICQQVCPWNQRFAPAKGDPALGYREEVARPDLLSDLALSDEAFQHKFAGSPILRARRRGYLRNATVALGNLGDPAAVPALADRLTGDSEALVRSHAAWALGQLGGRPARTALEKALAMEKDAATAAEIQAALG